MGDTRLRCRHAFETVTVHGNGEVVCSIIDGRGDFVVGNVYKQSLPQIFNGPRFQELRRLVLSTPDQYCRAIGKHCPLKTRHVSGDELEQPVQIKLLAIEPTSACDLACLTCPIRDFDSSISWRNAYRDGGMKFWLWDSVRRFKQHTADVIRSMVPSIPDTTQLNPMTAKLLRGRVHTNRNGTLPLSVIQRVIEEAGEHVERVDFFNYGEPFLYRPLNDALRHVRKILPKTEIAISTNGMQVHENVEDQIISERLLDWLLFSVDGSDAEHYQRYRIGGTFETAFGNLCRFSRKAKGSGIHVIWQYVVFEWNDSDDQLKRAIDLAADQDLTLWFDFSGTWGRSRRKTDELQYLVPYLKPFVPLPGEQRYDGR